jgi:arylsulfatase A-like enzyme
MRWLARAMVDSLIAGLAVGAIELTRVALASNAEWGPSGAAGLGWMIVGLVALGAALAGPILCAAAWALGRAPPVAAWVVDVRAGGGARSAALARAAVFIAAVVMMAGVTFAVASWTHEQFVEPRPIALLEAAVLPAAGLLLLVLAGAAARWLGARAAACEGCARRTSGRRGAALVAAGAIALMVGVPALAAAAAPAAELARPAALLQFAVLLALVRGLGVGRRRRSPVVAAVAGLLALSAPFGLSSTPSARAAISGHGAASRQVIELVWRAFDRDGDGVPSHLVGGADCDDGDAGVSPSVPEVIDNGRDENCNGQDASRAALAHRLGARRPASTTVPHHNVLLISIDSLRADHVGAYGYRRPTTPALDAFAAGATRFAWAFSTTPSTRWAIPSLATGRYASAAGTAKKGAIKRAKARTIGQVLTAAGYDTHGVMCCSVFFGKPTGALAGLETVDDSANRFYKSDRKEKYNSDELATRVIAFLSQRKRGDHPFFLWTHIIDPHHPYFHLPGTPDFGDKAPDRYDSEVAFVDQQIARVLRALERDGLDQRTIVVITADHGDGFKEHGTYHHGKSLYNQELHVPLLVRVPGAAPRVVDRPVSLVDLAPTLYDLIGIAGPPGMNGQSVAAGILTGDLPPRPILAELFPDREISRSLLAVIDGCDKLIWDRQANTQELYSLCSDAADAHDRAPAEPEHVDRLRHLLDTRSEIELTPLPPAWLK